MPFTPAPNGARGGVPAPSPHRRALLTWFAVYVSITGAQALFGDAIAGQPLPVRTLLLTVVVVPLVVYVLVPGLLRLNNALSRRCRHH